MNSGFPLAIATPPVLLSLVNWDVVSLLVILIFFKIIDTELDINAADLYQRNPAKIKLVTKNWTYGFTWLDISWMCDAPGKSRKTRVKESDCGKVWAWVSTSV